jgi:hypothetical protein
VLIKLVFDLIDCLRLAEDDLIAKRFCRGDLLRVVFVESKGSGAIFVVALRLP